MAPAGVVILKIVLRFAVIPPAVFAARTAGSAEGDLRTHGESDEPVLRAADPRPAVELGQRVARVETDLAVVGLDVPRRTVPAHGLTHGLHRIGQADPRAGPSGFEVAVHAEPFSVVRRVRDALRWRAGRTPGFAHLVRDVSPVALPSEAVPCDVDFGRQDAEDAAAHRAGAEFGCSHTV
jgi:hypothetical protein